MKLLLVFVLATLFANAYSIDPCSVYNDCSTCIAQEDCGFSAELNLCLTGDEEGPVANETVDWFYLECLDQEEILNEDLTEEEQLLEEEFVEEEVLADEELVFEDETTEEEELLEEELQLLEEEEGDLEIRRKGKKVLLTTGVIPVTSVIVTKGGRHRKGIRKGFKTTVVPVTSVIVTKGRGHRKGVRKGFKTTVVPVTSIVVTKGGRRHRKGFKTTVVPVTSIVVTKG
jgi:hypothetical protein